jgi:uncharacterized membrane protein YkvA (DUF1232 family)
MSKLWRYAYRARLLTHVTALWLVMKDRRTPLAARLIGGLVLAYALSPIDLIPDFIPVLGLVDDLVLIPLGIAVAIRFIPRAQWHDALQRAEQVKGRLPKVMWGIALVLLVWLLLLAGIGWWIFSLRPLV